MTYSRISDCRSNWYEINARVRWKPNRKKWNWFLKGWRFRALKNQDKELVIEANYTRFYKQRFYKQYQAKIGKLSNTLRVNFCYLKIIHFLHPFYHPTLIWDIAKIVQKTSVCFNEIKWLIIMKMRVKLKNRSHRYDINWTTPKHGYKSTK